jgi:hypothetical protein
MRLYIDDAALVLDCRFFSLLPFSLFLRRVYFAAWSARSSGDAQSRFIRPENSITYESTYKTKKCKVIGHINPKKTKIILSVKVL